MHRNLLAHRDLKPVTVLLDTEGQVKLLDFGIAKALDPLEAAGAAEGNPTVGGVRPTGRNATTPAEAARSVLEQAPTRLSRLSADEAVQPRWLQTRKRLEGDLDNILLKMPVEDPAERHASVDALAGDIRDHIEDHEHARRTNPACEARLEHLRRLLFKPAFEPSACSPASVRVWQTAGHRK